MEEFLTLLTNGLVLSSVYALLAASLTLIFGVLGLVNFAHGELYMLGGFAAYFATQVISLDYFTSIVVVAVVMALLGGVAYLGVLRPLEGDRNLERGILVTLGASILLQNGAIMIWSAQPRSVSTPYDFQPVDFGLFTIPLLRVITVALVIAIFIGLYVLLMWTDFGRSMRAVTQNPRAAAMVGIKTTTVSMCTVAIGVGLAGAAGAILAPIFTVTPAMGINVLFKSFAVVIIGGLGSVPGAVVAALLLGVSESFAGGYGSATIQDSIAFIAMMAVLFLRPQGLLGRVVRI